MAFRYVRLFVTILISSYLSVLLTDCSPRRFDQFTAEKVVKSRAEIEQESPENVKLRKLVGQATNINDVLKLLKISEKDLKDELKNTNIGSSKIALKSPEIQQAGTDIKILRESLSGWTADEIINSSHPFYNKTDTELQNFIPPKDGCGVKNITEHIPNPEGKTIFPNCFKIEKCLGCIDPDKGTTHECEAIEAATRSLVYLEFDRNMRHTFKFYTTLQHTKCEQRCRLKPHHCTSKQNYNVHACQCQCKTTLDCPPGKVFDWDLCQCNCRYRCRPEQIQHADTCQCSDGQAAALARPTTRTIQTAPLANYEKKKLDLTKGGTDGYGAYRLPCSHVICPYGFNAQERNLGATCECTASGNKCSLLATCPRGFKLTETREGKCSCEAVNACANNIDDLANIKMVTRDEKCELKIRDVCKDVDCGGVQHIYTEDGKCKCDMGTACALIKCKANEAPTETSDGKCECTTSKTIDTEDY